ncbi:MAG: putative DNA base hypermodification protein [Rhodospirillaceae bacterium]
MTTAYGWIEAEYSFSCKSMNVTLSNMSDRRNEFFDFVKKREALRLVKETGASWPWSDDQILNTYKFTNVKREFDRTTKWMRRFWTLPHHSRPAGEIIFNCGLFRYFGTVELAEAIGWQDKWVVKDISEKISKRVDSGHRVFTGAYIIPTLGKKEPKHIVVVRDILSSLWNNRDQLAEIAEKTQSWKQVGAHLSQLPGYGGTGFMVKELLQDVMQTPVLSNAVDRNTWCPAGPGARRGLNRVFMREFGARAPESKLLDEMINLFESRDSYLPATFPELELHDVQFQLCEFDKYERVRLGQGKPKAKYHYSD